MENTPSSENVNNIGLKEAAYDMDPKPSSDQDFCNAKSKSTLIIKTIQYIQDGIANIPHISIYKCILATIVLWNLSMIPFIAILVPGWIYTNDVSEVFLLQGCLDWATQTIFVFCFLRILMCSFLLKRYIVPVIFGTERLASFNFTKQRKMEALSVTIILKLVCLIQMLVLIAPKVSFDEGLFPMRGTSLVQLEQNHTILSCKSSEITKYDVMSIRAWYSVRIDFMALLLWELSFIPGLHYTDWLHHLCTTISICFLTDARFISNKSDLLPFLDLSVFGLFLGGPCGAFAHGCVLMYHLYSRKPTTQVVWMQLSILLHSIIIMFNYIVFPTIVIVKHFKDLGGLVWVIMTVTLIFNVVEGKILHIKMSIVQHVKNKVMIKDDEQKKISQL